MTNINQVQQQYTAGPNAIGFDYQFFYFMFLALDLSHGDIIGFESKDDVHIQRNDGTLTLYQGKHSVQTNVAGEIQNLTTLDIDLWKTMSNWVKVIEAESDPKAFLDKTSFLLFTNKNEHFNEFITALTVYKNNGDHNKLLTKINELRTRAKDKFLKGYIKKVASFKIKYFKIFMSQVIIETGFDDIIERIKNRIKKTCRIEAVIDSIFDKLVSSMHTAKYLDIKHRGKFEISLDDFNSRFGRCFLDAYKERPLPRREFPVLLPQDLENQVFIRQLIDIGEIASGSKDVIKYTQQMLQVINHFSHWLDENLLFPEESKKCDENAILIWENKFKSTYREIKRRMDNGSSLEELEDDIRSMALNIIDYLREQDLDILEDKLGIEFSNGHYYALSNKLQLGWHLDWEKKYQRS